MKHLAERDWRVLCGGVAICMACGCANLHNHPSDSTDLPSLTPEELVQVALFQAGRGDLFRAEQYLVAARIQGYDESKITYWLVRVCISAGRYHSALRHAREHLNRDPSNWRLRLVVASIHEALGEVARAREQYLALEPVGAYGAEVRAALGRLGSLGSASAEEVEEGR